MVILVRCPYPLLSLVIPGHSASPTMGVMSIVLGKGFTEIRKAD